MQGEYGVPPELTAALLALMDGQVIPSAWKVRYNIRQDETLGGRCYCAGYILKLYRAQQQSPDAVRALYYASREWGVRVNKAACADALHAAAQKYVPAWKLRATVLNRVREWMRSKLARG